MTNNKKGDLVDGMLFFNQNSSDPIQFSDYPETVVATLRDFYNVWKVPSYVIPSKKNKSKFEDWILQLDELNNICPNRTKMEKAMGLSKEIYGGLKNRFMITRPSSIKNLLADAVRRLNDGNDSNEDNRIEKEEQQEKEIVIMAEEEEKRNVLKNMKKKLRG